MLQTIEYERMDFEDSLYVRNKVKWKASTLYKAAEEQGCEPFDLPLIGIDLDRMPFNIDNIDDFIYHMKRVMLTNLEYPIMLDWTGSVVDGWHRIAKAILTKKEFIKAIRLKKYIEHDYVEIE